MKRIATLALLALAPAGAQAQDATGWELRAGLSLAEAKVCNEEGACFGISCSAGASWAPIWFALVQPVASEPPADPIVAVRISGENTGRHALTSLSSAAGGTAELSRYEGRVTTDDDPLLASLLAGDAVTLDPGREFSTATFTLRASRWAVTEALALCGAGGPDTGTDETPDAE